MVDRITEAGEDRVTEDGLDVRILEEGTILPTQSLIIKYGADDTAGVVGQQLFKTKAKFDKQSNWQLVDKLNKITKFTTTISNDAYAQANIQIERSIFLPFKVPFYGVICGRSETPNVMNVEICEKAFHMTRKIYTKDGYKKHNYTDENWYNSSWTHRLKCHVTDVKVADDVKDIPLLFQIPANLSFANNAQADGDDFIFTQKDGVTVIPHEIENYNSTTGLLTAWVKFAKVSDTRPREFYIYYGNAGASNQEQITSVWDDCFTVDTATALVKKSYAMVQHFDSSSTDSTLNNNDGTDTSIVYTTDDIIGNAATFDGVDSKIDCGSGASIDDIFNGTGGWLTVWFNAASDGEGNEGMIISKGDDATSGWHVEVNQEVSGFMKLHFNQHFSSVHGEWETTNAIIAANQEYRLDIFYDDGNVANNPIFWINGVEYTVGNGLTEVTTPSGTAQTDGALNLIIGNLSDQSRTFDGYIDEVRLMKDAPSNLEKIIPTQYNAEIDNPTMVYVILHEEYKKAANLIAQDILDSANADTTMPMTWTLDQDFPTAVSSVAIPYKNHFDALQLLAEVNAMDIWFDNKSYKVFMGQKGKTLTDELDITIVSDPEITVENFANEINILGKKDDITGSQISDVVTTATNLRFDYEKFVSDTKLTDVTQLNSIATNLLNEFKELTPTIAAEIPVAQYEKYNLQSGDIFPIYQPDKQVQGNFRIMEIKASPQSVKLRLESTETGVIRLRSVSLTGVIEGILKKLQNQSIEN
jgi:hypothetical protein